MMTKTHHGSTRKKKVLKNTAFKNFCNNSSNIDLICRLKFIQASPNVSIEVVKENNIIIQ